MIRYPNVHNAMALACKRPRTRRSVGRAVQEARRQIINSGLPGAIVIGLEAVFHESGVPSGPSMLVVGRPAEAAARGAEIAQQIEFDLTVQPERVTHVSIAGIYLCGVMTYWSQQPSAYGFVWIRRSVPNASIPYAPETLEALDQLLFTAPQ